MQKRIARNAIVGQLPPLLFSEITWIWYRSDVLTKTCQNAPVFWTGPVEFPVGNPIQQGGG